MKEVDLHGVKHEDVSMILDKFFWEHMQKKTPCVRVITGNSAKMKELVNSVIQEYGFDVDEELLNTGALIVTLI